MPNNFWKLLCSLLALLLFSCAHTPEPVIERDISQWLGLPDVDSNTQQKARVFDKVIHGQASGPEVQELVDDCKKRPTDNPFCHSYLHLKTLNKKIQNWTQIPVFSMPKPVEPITPKLHKGRVQDWSKIKNANVKAVVKGLAVSSLADLNALKSALSRNPGCPDAVSPAVAASLEDHFPKDVRAKTIAQLYDKAARCAADPYDKDHFYTRAGLLHLVQGDCDAAIKFFTKAAKLKEAFTARAQYWLYQCQAKLGKADAQKTLDSLFQNYPLSFHAVVLKTLLGQQEVGKDYLTKERQFSLSRRSKRDRRVNPLVEQAEILRQSRLFHSAALISNWALDDYPRVETDVRLYLGWLGDAHARVVVGNELIGQPRKMSRTVLELFFPLSYNEVFEKYSKGVDPYLLMSIARQESTFNDHAISPANARGLLQVTPDTAAKVASVSENELFDPATNIRVAAKYFSELLDRNDGFAHYALAAYNAGEDKLNMWKTKYPGVDPILFIDLISYRETRNYVASVLRNYFWYRRIYANDPKPKLLGK